MLRHDFVASNSPPYGASQFYLVRVSYAGKKPWQEYTVERVFDRFPGSTYTYTVYLGSPHSKFIDMALRTSPTERIEAQKRSWRSSSIAPDLISPLYEPINVQRSQIIG